MSPLAFLFWIILLWLCLHALPSLLSRLFPRSSLFHSGPSSTPLPLTSSTRRTRSSQNYSPFESSWKSRNWTVHVSKLHFRISSTALNEWHESYCRVSSRTSVGTKKADGYPQGTCAAFYEIGNVAGIFGMMIAISFLGWTCWILSQNAWALHTPSMPHSTYVSSSDHRFAKRHSTSLNLSPSDSTNALGKNLQLTLLVQSIYFWCVRAVS